MRADQINATQHYFVKRSRLGIPTIPFKEAVHGIQRDEAMLFLQASALAVTLDTELNERVAGAIADEVRKRGIRDVRSPVVAIAEDVRGGRLEDTYGKGPYFASAMAHTFVATFEKKGVVTTPKHFVANVAEGGRESYPTGVTDRTL